MLDLVLTLSLSCIPQSGADPVPASAKVVVPEKEVAPREAARRITRALKNDDLGGVLEVLKAHGRVDDGAVARAIASGLKHKTMEVRWACLIALRFSPNVVAVSKLINANRNKLLFEHRQTAIEFYRAIGQHGDKRTLRLLLEGLGPPTGEEKEIVSVRIEAVARIRSFDAIEGIVKYLRSGFEKRGSPVPARGCFALAALTGEDEGDDPKAWVMWWNASRRSIYKIPEEDEPAPRVKSRWEAIWKVPEPEKAFAAVEGKARRQGTGDGNGRR